MKTRKCLRCSKDFPSEWAGNRICEKCRTFFNNPINGKLVTREYSETGSHTLASGTQ